MCIARHGNPSQSYRASLAIWYHAVLPANLPHNTSERTRLNPSQTGRYSIYLYPRRMGGWVDLGAWLRTEMVYLPAVLRWWLFASTGFVSGSKLTCSLNHFLTVSWTFINILPVDLAVDFSIWATLKIYDWLIDWLIDWFIASWYSTSHPGRLSLAILVRLDATCIGDGHGHR